MAGDGHDGGGRLHGGHRAVRARHHPDEGPATPGGRLNGCGLPDQGREEEGVQGAPGVELFPGQDEAMRGGPHRQGQADDAALVVVLGVRDGGQSLPDRVFAPATGGGQFGDRDGLALGQEPQQRHEQFRVYSGARGGQQIGEGLVGGGQGIPLLR